ncbi:unnamed protein product [Rangifer tarandus platyrhynchus]|uniref:Uncharacterized protein n=1 Tax=Rangifer tarandus platyrhynchus TaxID=3082113 RepID=A0AC60A8W2_RANTA
MSKTRLFLTEQPNSKLGYGCHVFLTEKKALLPKPLPWTPGRGNTGSGGSWRLGGSPLPRTPASPRLSTALPGDKAGVLMQPPSLERPSLQSTEKAVNEGARGSERLVGGGSSAESRVLSRSPPAWVPRSRRPLCPSEAPCLAYPPGQWPLDPRVALPPLGARAERAC